MCIYVYIYIYILCMMTVFVWMPGVRVYGREVLCCGFVGAAETLRSCKALSAPSATPAYWCSGHLSTVCITDCPTMSS